MTKHLRFLIVLLMTLVWSTGGAQTTIWSEDWTGGKANQTPSSFNRAIYTQSSNSNVYIYAGGDYAGGKAPELMIKSNSSWTVKITDLKGCKGDVTLTLKTNQKRRLTVSVGSSVINLTAVEGQTKTFSGTFNVDELVVPFNIVFKNTSSDNLRLDDISLIGTSVEESKTDTKVSFGSNSGKSFTFTEGENADDTFTAPIATETTGVEGTIVYSSDNESAVKVNASTGALSFPGYGEATITATFTPNNTETYAVSTDSYKVKNEAKKSDNILTFSNDFHSFDNAAKYSKDLPEVNVSFVGSDNNSYTFTTNGGNDTYGGIQRFILKKTKGKLVSPVFSSYVNGYNVVITYGIGGEGFPSVTANGKKVTGTVKGDYTKGTGATLSLDVADGSAFTVTSGTNALAISKIEITPNAVDETETLTLYESATNTLVAKTGVNVTLKRSMVENEWNTICLPFNVTAEQAKTAFGEGVMIAQLNKNSSGNKLSFSSVDAIVASTPYLIKPTIAAPADGYKFEGVTIRPDGKGNVAPNFVNTNSYLAFVGIYNTVDVTNNVIEVLNNNYYAAFLGANNTIFKAKNDGGKMKGFRAYFAIPNNVAASALCVMVNGTTTSIKSINGAVVESNAPVYNLQGQRVDGNNLTPGIYIKAGKKFVVR